MILTLRNGVGWGYFYMHLNFICKVFSFQFLSFSKFIGDKIYDYALC